MKKILINAISSKEGGMVIVLKTFYNNIMDYENQYYFLTYSNTLKDLKPKKNIHIIQSFIGNKNYILRFFWYQFKLPRFIKKNKFDCMINLTDYGPFNPKCGEILLLQNCKLISDKIKQTYSIKNKILVFIEKLVFKITLFGIDKLVVQTQSMKNGIITKFNFPSEKISVIPSCPTAWNLSEFNENLEKKINIFIGNEKNVLSCITMYRRYKNVERLVEAIKYVKEKKIKVKLILTIDEDKCLEAKKLMELVNKYKLNDYILNVGSVKHKYIYQILNKSRAFVFPSFAESFGIPYVEAMRFKLPIIAADLDFAHDVCGQAALYFKYNDEIMLGDCIMRLLNDKELYLKLRNESNLRNNLYNEKEIIGKYLNLLDL